MKIPWEVFQDNDNSKYINYKGERYELYLLLYE